MVDLEAIGGATTGGLIASSFEKPTGHAGEAHGACADCGTETIGRFCHNCGNTSHVHRTLLHLGEELLHGVMHFDSRTWRTLPLLAFRPGRLTREWCQGKRTRYVSPLAMFLFTMFVMFMGLSYMPHKPERSLAEQQIEASARLVGAASAVSEAERGLASATPQTRADRKEALADAKEALDEAQQRVNELREARRESAAATSKVGDDLKANLKFNTGNRAFDDKLNEKLKNPELALYKLQQAFYKFSFLLVPISIPFVALLFPWKRGVTLYDHGVFVLYSLTFMATLVMATAVATRIGGLASALVWASVPFLVPVHMFFQLNGAYGLSTFSALWRTWVLLWFCAIAFGLFVAAVVMLMH
jgi:hypothetical protein